MAGYLLGIDNGGSISKAVLFDLKGDEIAVACREVNQIQSFHGWNERDANEMWKDTFEIIREVLNKSKVNPKKVLAVACTGHGNGLYLVDEKGNPVRNSINSTDSRAQKYIENWRATGIEKNVLSLTAQSLWAGQPNALLAWLWDHEPETIAKARWVLMAKDFIRMKLTGKFFAEITDMSGTSLMNVITGKYDSNVLKNFGLEEFETLLPPLIGSADLAGKISHEAARLTGLKPDTPVAGGMFDIDACSLASGIIDEGQMSLIAGTWGNNQYIAQQPLIDKDLFMTSIYSIPGWYLMLEGSPTSASNLDWFINTFLHLEKEQKGALFFEWLNQQVASVSPRSSNIIFLPFLFGCNEGSDMKSGFYGIKGNHNISQIIRAVYEGIVFSHKTHVDRLLNYREKPDVIRCTGGAAQSQVWMQMFADTIGIPMEIPEGSQLGALGAAIAASVCCGIYNDFEEAVRAMTRIKRRFNPNSSLTGIYKMKFQEYKDFINRQLQIDN